MYDFFKLLYTKVFVEFCLYYRIIQFCTCWHNDRDSFTIFWNVSWFTHHMNSTSYSYTLCVVYNIGPTQITWKSLYAADNYKVRLLVSLNDYQLIISRGMCNSQTNWTYVSKVLNISWSLIVCIDWTYIKTVNTVVYKNRG